MLQALRAEPSQAAQNHAARYVLESVIYQEKKQFDEAQSWLEKGFALYPDNPHLLMAQGGNLLNLRRFNEARDYFLNALKSTQQQPLLRSLMLNNVAYTNVLIGGSELLAEADRFSVEAMTHLSWIPSIKGTRGVVLLELGQRDEAISLLRDAMQRQDVPNGKAQDACWLAIAETQVGNLPAMSSISR